MTTTAEIAKDEHEITETPISMERLWETLKFPIKRSMRQQIKERKICILDKIQLLDGQRYAIIHLPLDLFVWKTPSQLIDMVNHVIFNNPVGEQTAIYEKYNHNDEELIVKYKKNNDSW